MEHTKTDFLQSFKVDQPFDFSGPEGLVKPIDLSEGSGEISGDVTMSGWGQYIDIPDRGSRILNIELRLERTPHMI